MKADLRTKLLANVLQSTKPETVILKMSGRSAISASTMWSMMLSAIAVSGLVLMFLGKIRQLF
jgi:hypothetical protein